MRNIKAHLSNVINAPLSDVRSETKDLRAQGPIREVG
jgi:hypothetical protein